MIKLAVSTDNGKDVQVLNFYNWGMYQEWVNGEGVGFLATKGLKLLGLCGKLR